MKRYFKRIYAALDAVKIIIKFEPLYIINALPQIVLNAVLPLLYIYFPKLIIQELTKENTYSQIAKVITIYAAILLIINIINTYLDNQCSLYTEKFIKTMKNEIGKITMELELKDIESASSRDIIEMAGNAKELTSMARLVQNIISNIITIVGLAYIIIQLDWLFILLVAATLTIKIVFVRLRYSYNKKMRLMSAQNTRVGNYLEGLAYFNNGGAKEIRLNNIQNWIMEKIKGYRNEMVNMQLKDFRRNTIFEVITAIIMTLQSFVILLILSARYIGGAISIADFTMYFSAVAAITTSLSGITERIGDFNQQVLNVADYSRLDNLKNYEKNNCNTTEPFNMSSKIEFNFHNVSFAYPNTDVKVLKNISIKISNKEKLVIVGLNGAGKTTFIKLLCKFYRPTSGTITLNGTDIWDIPNKEYYRVIAAVFQDFANLDFSLRENVSMSEEADSERVRKAISEVGLGEYIVGLSKALDTFISKQFDDTGIELSGGQAQKLAIARAIYKDTPVLILDEPTASLDPKSESEIYSDFFQAAKDKTTIFISHRLAASTIADNIAVFCDGRITEYGSYAKLMEKNGVYTEMFRKQSRHYVDESKIF